MMDHEHDGGSNASENNPTSTPQSQSDRAIDLAVDVHIPDQAEPSMRANERSSGRSTRPAGAFGAFGARVKQAFSPESLRAFGQRIHWPWVRSSSMGWLLAVGAAALFIQAVGLYNMLAVADEKQQWDASAAQRQTIESELTSLLDKKAEAQQALIAAQASLEHEQSRLTGLRAAIKIDQTLRNEAQRDHATADAEAKRLVQENETLAGRLKDYSLRLDTTERQVTQLEAKRDDLAKQVAASTAIIEEHRAEVAKATKHCQDLDKQAFDTLAAIRTTRESLVKAQSDLDAAVRETARAEAQRDAALTRLKNAELLEADATAKVDDLRKQAATLAQSLDDQQSKLQSLTDARTKAGASLEAVQADLLAANKQLAESQGTLAAIKTHVEQATQAQQKLKTEQAELTATLKPLRSQQTQLQADIAAKQHELKALREQLDAAKQAAAKQQGAKQAAATQSKASGATKPSPAKPDAPAPPVAKDVADNKPANE